MRILHISKKYPNAIGGDAIVVFNLELHQTRTGHNVTVLTSNSREVIRKKNVMQFGLMDNAANYDRITLKRIISLVLCFLTSLRVLSAIKPDIIHTHSAELGFLVSFLAKIYHIPIIQTCHGICFNDRIMSSIKRIMEAFLLKYGFFTYITTVDKCSLEDFSRQGIRNVRYIPNGVDIAPFSGKSIHYTHPMKFLCVGRLEHQKGFDFMIEAAMNLKKVTGDFQVNIIGNGSLRDELAMRISSSSLEDTVHLLGSVPKEELVQQYICSDAFILPSRWEGMPLTLLEAWAAGLPAIVTNVGGLPEICTDMENAIVVNPGDPNALCRAMSFLMEHPDVAERLGSKGNRIARTLYSWESVGDQYLALYRELIPSSTCCD